MTRRRLAAALATIAVLALFQLSVATAAMAAPLTARPQMALGFDDVPQAVYPLLLTLDQKHVKATFFVVGELAEANPAQLLAVANDGMLIGNHSYDHPDFATATATEIRSNLSHAQTVIHDITGITPHWYRSPFLSWNNAYDTVLPELGLKISWPDINPKDWAGTAPIDICNYVCDREAPGAVVELHDMEETNTVTALPRLIDWLHEDGYDLVTLDDIGLGAIEGTATDLGGSGLGGALVTAYDNTGSVAETTTTNLDGSYRLARLKPAPYRVGFSAPGHNACYYGATTDLAHATPVIVDADYTIAGAGAALPLTVLDATPPHTTDDAPAGWQRSTVTVTLTATDTSSGVAVTRYRLNGGATTVYSAPIAVSAEGTTTIAYWSTDLAGNVEATETATVLIDHTAPHTSAGGVSGWHKSPFNVTLSASDAFSGVAATFYRLNGAASSTYTVPVAISAEGSNTLLWWSIDAAGNVEATQSASVLLDMTLPDLSLDATPAYTGSATIHASATDALSGLDHVDMRLDSGGWSATQSLSTSVAGTHTVSARAFDKAGNERDVSATITVVAPAPIQLATTTTLTGPSSVRTGWTLTLSGSVSPGQAPGTVTIVRTRWNGTTWQKIGSATVSVASGRFSWSFKPGTRGSWRFVATYSGGTLGSTTYKSSTSPNKDVAVR